MQVVNRGEAVGEELFGFEEVVEIGAGVIQTSETFAGWINGRLVGAVLRVIYINSKFLFSDTR